MAAKVLIADDEDLLRRLTRRVLTGDGVDVVTAADGDAALDAVVADPEIGVVLLDVTMPPRGGGDTLVEILRVRPEVGVILTSGSNLPAELEAELIACGGLFLRKPFAPQALVDAVRQART